MQALQRHAAPEHADDLVRLRAWGWLSTSREFEVHYDEMTFFTHQVNGRTYGGWYRQLAPHEIEVMGAGLLCKTTYAGCDELSVARSVLEDFLRMQLRSGGHPHPLDERDSAGD